MRIQKHDKWQFGFRAEKCPPWRAGFYPTLEIWALKIVLFPTKEGYALSKENYKGFMWRWEFVRNLIVVTRAFVVPHWLRQILRLRCAVYSVPIWFYFSNH